MKNSKPKCKGCTITTCECNGCYVSDVVDVPLCCGYCEFDTVECVKLKEEIKG